MTRFPLWSGGRGRRMAAAAALLLSTPVAAQRAAPAPPSPLVSAEWLGQHLRDPGLVLLHVGEKADFDREHLPGARFVSLDDVSLPPAEGEGALTLQMAEEPQIRAALEDLGVSEGSTVVVYPAANNLTAATRLVFALQYAGLGAQTALLDGGMEAWKRGGRPVTAEAASPPRGSLSPRAPLDLIVGAEWVRDHLHSPGVTVVDARAPEFYDGTREAGPRLGHIAGAVSLPSSELVGDDLLLRDPDRLRALFESAGVKPGDTVVAYCHIGQQASAVAFAARLLGYDVKLYDGSFQEWSRRPELPVEIRR